MRVMNTSSFVSFPIIYLSHSTNHHQSPSLQPTITTLQNTVFDAVNEPSFTVSHLVFCRGKIKSKSPFSKAKGAPDERGVFDG
jgi:hypothetical protein